jgi:hypothetical protein
MDLELDYTYIVIEYVKSLPMYLLLSIKGIQGVSQSYVKPKER